MTKVKNLLKLNLFAFALIATAAASLPGTAEATVGLCEGKGKTCQVLVDGKWVDFKQKPPAA